MSLLVVVASIALCAMLYAWSPALFWVAVLLTMLGAWDS
jgi:hypothetical protein